MPFSFAFFLPKFFRDLAFFCAPLFLGTWVAVGAAAVSVVGGAVTANNKPKVSSLPNDVYDAYGRRNTPNQGAIDSMGGLFNKINSGSFQGDVGQATGNYINSLNSAASDPGIGAAYRSLLGTVKGDNLQSDLVNKYADQAFQSQVNQGADQAARTRSQFARGGVGFSTGNQQAQQADMAAAASKGAAARSGILSQNEQYERGLQQQAIPMLNQQIGVPASYLGQINNAMYAPLQSQANLTTQLLGNNNVNQPTYLQQPGTGAQLANGVSTAAGLYSAFRNSGMLDKKTDTSGYDSSPNGAYNDMYKAMYPGG